MRSLEECGEHIDIYRALNAIVEHGDSRNDNQNRCG